MFVKFQDKRSHQIPPHNHYYKMGTLKPFSENVILFQTAPSIEVFYLYGEEVEDVGQGGVKTRKKSTQRSYEYARECKLPKVRSNPRVPPESNARAQKARRKQYSSITRLTPPSPPLTWGGPRIINFTPDQTQVLSKTKQVFQVTCKQNDTKRWIY